MAKEIVDLRKRNRIIAFREEEFLLYSLGTTLTFETQKPILWLNLTAFNGDCWVTFGPIIGFNGFDALSKDLLHLPIENMADVVVSLPMKTTAEMILGREIELNTYEELFSVKVSNEDKEQLDQINNFLQMLIPYANSDEEPDLHNLALKADIPYENALELWKVVVRGRIQL